MWELRHDGRRLRADDLTLAEVERVEAAAGVPWEQVVPWRHAAHLRAVGTVVLARWYPDPDVRVSGLRLSDVAPAESDLPSIFRPGERHRSGSPEGLRVEGGRFGDRWVLQLTMPPWTFTPAQIRNEFTIRDLHLLVAGAGG